ncbi:MAG: Gldg family protein [Planctomycetota bacterium]
MNRTTLTSAGVVLAVILFLLVNLASNALLSGSRMDLTEHQLYTLSEGSRRLVAGLAEPVTLRLYYSERVASDIPQIRGYAQRVRGLLEEYAEVSGGNVRLEIIDPEPFSEEEDTAVAAGLQGVMIESGPSDLLYFGLVASGPTDERAQIPFFDPAQEASLEYDLGRLIHKLGTTSRPVVGVLAGLSIEGQPSLPFPGAPPASPAWYLLEQLRERFDVRMLRPDALEIPPDCRLLMVVHPKDFPEATLYALDQFVLAGGRLLAFTDPHCEEDRPPEDPSNPTAALMSPKASELNRLFQAWGLEMLPDKVLGDRDRAIKVRSGSATRPEPIDHVLWLKLMQEDLSPDDFVTAELQTLNLASSGILRPLSGATTEFVPLISSSPESMAIDLSAVQFWPDLKRLLLEFMPLGQRQVVAARVSGPVKSAFPDGRPAPVNEFEETAVVDDGAAHLAESVGPIQVILVADVDMLADGAWVHMQNFLGQVIPLVRSSNGDFVLTALDNLSNNAELFQVPRRASASRPFEVMAEIRRDAEQRFLAREQELQQALATTESRLAELQTQRADGGSLLLSQEQRDEIERFREEQVATRKALRDVQHDLRKDIESLETTVKVLNIGVVPLLVGVLALTLGALRSRRRRAA